jgi:hypothetical protein
MDRIRLKTIPLPLLAAVWVCGAPAQDVVEANSQCTRELPKQENGALRSSDDYAWYVAVHNQSTAKPLAIAPAPDSVKRTTGGR